MKKRKVKGIQGDSNSSKKKRREDEISEGGKRRPAAEEAGPVLMTKMKKRKEKSVDGDSDSSKKKMRKEKRVDGDSDSSTKKMRKEKRVDGDHDGSKKKMRKGKRLEGDSSSSKKERRKEKTSEGDCTAPFKLLPKIISRCAMNMVQFLVSLRLVCWQTWLGSNFYFSGGESKNAARRKNKETLLLKKEKRSTEHKVDAKKGPVAEISSVDEDCSRGMKKWVMEYQQRRPGLDVIQQRLNEFIASYEAEQEQAKREREARAAGEGWTVVVHHKGRKKTTDSESGVAVGSVSQAAVEQKMTQKKEKELALDFYRFQRREARRNDRFYCEFGQSRSTQLVSNGCCTCGNKFEQDKKRVQQLRAARKFRPY
ncbi:unnamed protein product [Spirodela intermedia]|uniref:Ribosomal RNA-processing protein 7 C-terminal domain-containing protein n=1 Tax=Spirodela intermedia TaxID=51605 RepID=A0A7I8L5L1_SPIIN|nr:unnamed protein product [Spirodela intermedia]